MYTGLSLVGILYVTPADNSNLSFKLINLLLIYPFRILYILLSFFFSLLYAFHVFRRISMYFFIREMLFNPPSTCTDVVYKPVKYKKYVPRSKNLYFLTYTYHLSFNTCSTCVPRKGIVNVPTTCTYYM